MKFGDLEFEPVDQQPALVAAPVLDALDDSARTEVMVSAIDDTLADTAAFCEAYKVGLDQSGNCVVVKAKRADRVWYAAVVVLATDFADINKTIKKHLDARKLSFAPMDEATKLTHMQYGGITPIGLPSDWPILIDQNVASLKQVIIGSGIRSSKILTRGSFLCKLPNAETMALTIERTT